MISLELASSPQQDKFSRTILKEAETFRERNSIAVLGHTLSGRKPIHKCCPNCLKAHLIKKAEELNLDRDLREVLFSMVEYETGHYGYYLDDGKLIKV